MKHLVMVVACVVGVGCGDSGGGPIDAPVTDDTLPDMAIDMAIDMAPGSTDAGTDMTLLSMQGVYGNFTLRTIPSDAIAYSVNYELWADSATKRRWVILAPGSAPIDNSNQESWRFPANARLVKEFKRGTTLVETRIIENVGTGTIPVWSMRTYVWRTDQTDADFDMDGAVDVAGTPHNAPSEAQCLTCHNGEPGKILGFSAVQLPATTLTAISAAGKLTNPIAVGTTFGPTGGGNDVAALGYLHGNCAHCHNPTGPGAVMNLRLDAATKLATLEPGYLSTVNQPTVNMTYGTERIDGMNNANSSIRNRMSSRVAGQQMPQIASEDVDLAGVAIIEAWIATLPP